MKCRFDRIEEFFASLNQANVNYLVLRNFENLHEPEMYVDGHGDIDLLCDDAQALVTLVEAQPNAPKESRLSDDGIHYLIFVDGNPVKLDLRQVGDGYYCAKWEKELLERRVWHECFYVMNELDYFYTLAYHAILQKASFSDEYLSRLNQMSQKLGFQPSSFDEHGYICLLEKHMRENGYCFSFSSDYMVPNRFHLVDEKLIEKNNKLKFRHRLFDLKVNTIEGIVKLKHLFGH